MLVGRGDLEAKTSFSCFTGRLVGERPNSLVLGPADVPRWGHRVSTSSNREGGTETGQEGEWEWLPGERWEAASG